MTLYAGVAQRIPERSKDPQKSITGPVGARDGEHWFSKPVAPGRNAPGSGSLILALFLALPAYASPDAGADVPLMWRLEKAGTTLQQDAAVTTPENAQAFDVGLRTCQGDRDGCMGEVKSGTAGMTTTWAIIGTAAGIVLGALLTAGALEATGHLK